MDTISTSNTIGLAFRLYDQGVITTEDTGGIELKWGEVDAIEQLVHMIGAREGIGDLLAQGPIVITAQIITALQQIVSRNADPTIPSVLTFGCIASDGGATNVIPNEVRLMGTFRTMNETWRFEAHRKMRAIVEGIAKSLGGSADFRIEVGYPVLINEAALTARSRAAAEAYLGPENVVELPIRMPSEDFAFYSHHVPACFYRLGTGNVARGITSPIHTNTFDVDEN